MPSTAPRYSVTIQIDEKLRKLKRETHDLCCAWGFRRDGSAETTYNIVGWASNNITSKESIDWTERYWVSASKEGCDPGFMVNVAIDPQDIRLGETFIFKNFEKTTIDTSSPPDDTQDHHHNNLPHHHHSIAFEARTPCSVVLYQGLDLGAPDENYTPVYIASAGHEPLTAPPPVAGTIAPARTLLFFFARKEDAAIRRKAFDAALLANAPIVYDYGARASRFTEVSLVYGVDGPQLGPVVRTRSSESFAVV
ncbi:hypothetical protein N3K66_007213 [Trichothecium roseum]|uniref:Uncharacterized protein n=1 Tax=Trichothecium roseum TaxID=47278 RepID=A0ACC0UV15_9HYPO|nr:hypothetical protein N3K66_007213 [Trichothecium roseum]